MKYCTVGVNILVIVTCKGVIGPSFCILWKHLQAYVL
jgi:hypothetical protein